MKLKEAWREIHISVIPVMGWTSAGKYLQMSPAALVTSLVQLFREHPENCDCAKCTEQREEKLKELLMGCTLACPVEDDDDKVTVWHQHILEPEEIAALINARVRVGMSNGEVHEIISEVFSEYEHT